MHKKVGDVRGTALGAASSPNLRLRRPLSHYCGLGTPSTTTVDLPKPLLWTFLNHYCGPSSTTTGKGQVTNLSLISTIQTISNQPEPVKPPPIAAVETVVPSQPLLGNGQVPSL